MTSPVSAADDVMGNPAGSPAGLGEDSEDAATDDGNADSDTAGSRSSGEAFSATSGFANI